jgi:predicted alpha-1,2-mannosidase
MNHHISFNRQLSTLLLVLLFPVMAFAQTKEERWGGVYFAYHAPVGAQLTPAPDGYRPFYISHYGRHGSRWLPSDSRYEWVNSQFADNKNLTKLGRSVKRRLQKVWDNARGNGGKLTPLGAEQHRGIARRMVEHYPEVFADGRMIEARSSTYDRCRKSMEAFCGELSHTTLITDSADMAWIAYTSPEVKALESAVHPRGWLTGQRLVAALFKNPTKVADADKLLSELHTIASDMQDVPLNLSFSDVLTDSERRSVYDQNNQRMWTINGLCPDNYGAAARSAQSLWQHIVADADAAIKDRNVAAHLRFGHDTNLYRLLALMGDETLSDERADKMDEMLPMAANMQMIFYTNGKDVLVKVLHNEREVKLGLRSTKVFLHWEEMKALVNRRILDFANQGRLQQINTMVGTDLATTTSHCHYGKGSEEHGQNIPAVLEPNGMNSWTPQTRATERKCVAPYYYQDTKWLGFRNSHWLNGGCAQDYGSFTLMPLMDSLRLTPETWGCLFSHDNEVSHPDYYSIVLPDEHLKAEMTGMSHCAFFRFTYQKDGKAYFVVRPNSDEGDGFVAVDTARNCLYGYNPVHRIYQGWGEKAGISGWYAVQFELPIEEYGVNGDVAWVAFDVTDGQELLAKAASSFVDLEGVMNNIAQEIPHWEFYDTRCRVIESWQKKMRRVIIDNGQLAMDNSCFGKRSKDTVTQFYSALYRASFLPRAFSDKDGRYPSFGGGKEIVRHSLGKIGGKELTQRTYMDFSMWDTYRALHPLNILIEPATSAMMQSLIHMYEQGGWLPAFPCWNSYTAAMIGDHCTAALADAMVKGVSNIDKEKAYAAMRKNAFTVASPEEYLQGKGRRAMDSYLKYGYVPLEDSVREAFHTQEQVSRTLEYAYDDFALAQVAKLLGKTDDYRQLMKRARNWRHVINPRTGWADGRYQNGRWLNNRDYRRRMNFITEGAPCHYTWYVPHDPYGLMEVMGGRERFVNRLDSMFTEELYWHGNEPCHQIPYLFNYAGEPWRTQKWVRHILDTEYADSPGGISGNDDAGQMSAWYVFSALGFYPVCPSTPYYIIGTPTFSHAQIGRFVVEAENVSHDNCYIQQATWNGEPYTRNYITHDMLKEGGVLHFVMGSQPNKQWGSRPEDCPPDVMKVE